MAAVESGVHPQIVAISSNWSPTYELSRDDFFGHVSLSSTTPRSFNRK